MVYTWWLNVPGRWYTYPSEKWWSSSVGMMTFPTESKFIELLFQTYGKSPFSMGKSTNYMVMLKFATCYNPRGYLSPSEHIVLRWFVDARFHRSTEQLAPGHRDSQTQGGKSSPTHRSENNHHNLTQTYIFLIGEMLTWLKSTWTAPCSIKSSSLTNIVFWMVTLMALGKIRPT